MTMAASAWKRPWCGDLDASDLGRAVELVGWVRRRRDLGGLVFVDQRVLEHQLDEAGAAVG